MTPARKPVHEGLASRRTLLKVSASVVGAGLVGASLGQGGLRALEDNLADSTSPFGLDMVLLPDTGVRAAYSCPSMADSLLLAAKMLSRRGQALPFPEPSIGEDVARFKNVLSEFESVTGRFEDPWLRFSEEVTPSSKQAVNQLVRSAKALVARHVEVVDERAQLENLRKSVREGLQAAVTSVTNAADALMDFDLRDPARGAQRATATLSRVQKELAATRSNAGQWPTDVKSALDLAVDQLHVLKLIAERGEIQASAANISGPMVREREIRMEKRSVGQGLDRYYPNKSFFRVGQVFVLVGWIWLGYPEPKDRKPRIASVISDNLSCDDEKRKNLDGFATYLAEM